MRSPELRDNAEGTFMIASLRNLEKGSVRRSSSNSRSSVVVKVVWKTDVLPTIAIRLFALKNLGDFRNLTSPDEKINIGQFLGEFLRISLGEDTSDDELINLYFLFEPCDLKDGVYKLSYSGLNEPESINKHNIRIFRFVHYVVVVPLQ